LVDEWVVTVVDAEIDVFSLLDNGVVPSVIDAKCYEIYGCSKQFSAIDGDVLLLKIACKTLNFAVSTAVSRGAETLTWSIMTSIGFSKEAEFPTLVLLKICKEGLKESPDWRCS
jgi:hypothetical protein